MSEKPSAPSQKTKKKRPRGFAATIWENLKPLNTSDYFKEQYGQDKMDIFLVATDDQHAALVHVNCGTIEVEDINTKKIDIKTIKANGRIITTYDDFMALAAGKLNPVKGILSRRLKLKGIKNILQFTKYFKVAGHIMGQRIKELKAQKTQSP